MSMQIQWLGLGSFRIQTKNSVIVTDPYSDNSGLKMPKNKADLVLVSDAENELANNISRLSGDSFVIDGPGEYEVGGTFVYGIPATNTVYLIEDEGLRVVFLGGLTTSLTDKQLELIEGSHILLLPVGTLSKEVRTVLISQIEPRVIIPYMYKQPKLKVQLDDLSVFLKEMGIKKATPEKKYTIKANQLPAEETNVVVLASE